MTAVPDPPMRLAYLGDPNEVHTRRWLTFFVERGHAVHLLVRHDTVLESPLPPGIVLERMDPFEIRWYRPDAYLAARRAVRRVLERIGAQVLHVHYLTGYGFWAWLSGFRPYVVTVWGSDVFRTLPTSRRHRLYGWLSLRGAAAVTADSVDLAEGAIAGGARRERTTVVQFGVDTARFSPAPKDEALRARIGIRTPKLVFSPRIIFSWNRHEDVIRAVAELPADVGLALSALHADPDYLASLVELARTVGIADRLTVLDGIPHAEMADHLRLADVVVSVPETDGTPVTILESLACGVPVVASDVPSVREWLAEFSPELLVPIADQAATTAAIRHVLDLPEDQAAALRAAGRALVVERGDHATHMLGVEATYRALAAAAASAQGRRTDGPGHQMSVIDRSGSALSNRVVIAFTARVTVAVIGLFSAFMLARLLGPAEKGEFTVGQILPSTIFVLGQLGLTSALSFYAGRGRTAGLTRRAVLLAAVLSAIGIAVTLLLLPFIEEHIFKNIDPVVLLGSLAVVPSLFAFAFMNSILTGRQQIVAYGLLAHRPGRSQRWSCTSSSSASSGLGARGAVLAYFLFSSGAALAAIWAASRATRHHTDEPPARVHELFHYGLRVYPASLSGFFSYRADVDHHGGAPRVAVGDRALQLRGRASPSSSSSCPIRSCSSSSRTSRAARARRRTRRRRWSAASR